MDVEQVAVPDLAVADTPVNDFHTHELNIAPKALDPEPIEEEVKESSEDEETEVEDTEAETQEKKPKLKGYKKKIAKLEAEVQQLRMQRETEVGTDEEPLEAKDFNTYEEYEDAKLERKLAKALQKQSKQIEQVKLEERQKILIERFTAQKEEAKRVHKDFDKVIQDYDANPNNPKPSALLQDAILESDRGGDVLYHLAKNPAEVAKMANMDERQLFRYLGKLEAQLDVKIPAVKTTNAPPPIKPVTKSITTSSDFRPDMSFDEYKRLRTSGKI